jgi:hypothetical protein
VPERHDGAERLRTGSDPGALNGSVVAENVFEVATAIENAIDRYVFCIDVERDCDPTFESDRAQSGANVVAHGPTLSTEIEAQAVRFDPIDIPKRDRGAGLLGDIVIERK